MSRTSQSKGLEASLYENDTFCTQNPISAVISKPPIYTETILPTSYRNAEVGLESRDTPFWLQLQVSTTKEESERVVDTLNNVTLYLSIIILLMLIHMNFFITPAR